MYTSVHYTCITNLFVIVLSSLMNPSLEDIWCEANNLMKQITRMYTKLPVRLNGNIFVTFVVAIGLAIEYKQSLSVTWMHSSPLIFLCFIYQNVSNS